MAMSRLEGCRSLIACPSTRISPEVIVSSPAMVLSSVDLPQPDGPTRTRKPPFSSVDVDALEDLDIAEALLQADHFEERHGDYPFTAPAIRPRTK